MAEKKVLVSDPKYRLDLYSPSGTIKHHFNSSIMNDVSRRYGDVMRAISSTRFMTLDEVCESVWMVERRMRYPSNRTRKQIIEALNELIERHIVITS